MTDLLLNHTTDTYKIKETGLSHSTDAYKAKSLTTAHTTDSYLDSPGTVAHSTSAATHNLPVSTHSTDAYKTGQTPPAQALAQGGTPTGGEVLSATTAVAPGILESEISKNPNTFLSIGDGLSVMIGLPRIATWNTSARPKTPKVGTMGFNSQTMALEFWDGTSWRALPMDQI